MSGNRYQSALVRMLELAMTAARAVKKPAVVFDEFDGVANFHNFQGESGCKFQLLTPYHIKNRTIFRMVYACYRFLYAWLKLTDA